jgi:xanthine dehydrogenase YagS FAD-binding subunit
MALANFDYYRPKSAAEASKVLATVKGTQAKAGGTDLLPMLKERLTEAKGLVNLNSINTLSLIVMADDTLVIGATTTLGAVAADEIVQKYAPAVAAAALKTATPQIRSRGTVGGNLVQRPRCWYFRHAEYECIKKGGSTCFAQDGENKYNAIFDNETSASVHPSNLAPAFWVHDATVHLETPKGVKKVPIAEFFVKPEDMPVSEVKLSEGEVILCVAAKPLGKTSGSAYLEVRERESFDWALVSAACRVDLEGGKASDLCLVASAVAPIPIRLEQAEAVIRGQKVTEELAWKAGTVAVKGAKPLRDNKYKVRMLEACVAHAILDATKNAERR